MKSLTQGAKWRMEHGGLRDSDKMRLEWGAHGERIQVRPEVWTEVRGPGTPHSNGERSEGFIQGCGMNRFVF